MFLRAIVQYTPRFTIVRYEYGVVNVGGGPLRDAAHMFKAGVSKKFGAKGGQESGRICCKRKKPKLGNNVAQGMFD